MTLDKFENFLVSRTNTFGMAQDLGLSPLSKKLVGWGVVLVTYFIELVEIIDTK